jgi:hypothetical protein
MKNLLLVLSAGLFIKTQTQAGPVTFTFDELPTQAVDGLTFGGVTYDTSRKTASLPLTRSMTRLVRVPPYSFLLRYYPVH